MTQASCSTKIHASVDAIWQVICDFSAAGQYLTGVETCTVEDEGVGALRTLTSTDGGMIVERLESLDVATHQLSYSLLTDTPFRNCLTTISLRELGSTSTELEWFAVFEPDGIPASEAEQMLQSALSENCLALKQFMER